MPSHNSLNRVRISLNVYLLNDAARATILTAIEKSAPQSPLMTNAAIAASYNALTAKGTTHATNVAAAVQAEQTLKNCITARDLSRAGFDRELLNLKTLVENNSTSPNDATSMGFTLLTLLRASRMAPEPPAVLDVKIGRAHGKATVAVHGQGYLGSFAAQMALDPLGQTPTWTELPGRGKSRRLSGFASGTKVWVRFAAVRFGMQSDWSVPVLVTIP